MATATEQFTPSASTAEFCAKLQSSNGYWRVVPISEEEWVVLTPLMFHWTMMRGLVGDSTGYEDRWCYADQGKAVTAYAEWHGRGFAGEPVGWHRHPKTGRRRPDGDASKEYVQW